MNLDPEQIGVSAGGGGIVGAVLAWLGFKSRLDAQDRKIEELQDNMLTKEYEKTCNIIHKNIDEKLTDIKVDVKQFKEDMKLLNRKMDEWYLNGR